MHVRITAIICLAALVMLGGCDLIPRRHPAVAKTVKAVDPLAAYYAHVKSLGPNKLRTEARKELARARSGSPDAALRLVLLEALPASPLEKLNVSPQERSKLLDSVHAPDGLVQALVDIEEKNAALEMSLSKNDRESRQIKARLGANEAALSRLKTEKSELEKQLDMLQTIEESFLKRGGIDAGRGK